MTVVRNRQKRVVRGTVLSDNFCCQKGQTCHAARSVRQRGRFKVPQKISLQGTDHTSYKKDNYIVYCTCRSVPRDRFFCHGEPSLLTTLSHPLRRSVCTLRLVPADLCLQLADLRLQHIDPDIGFDQLLFKLMLG